MAAYERPLSEPPYSRPCGRCAQGFLWRTPDGGTMRFCHPHSRIIRDAPGWTLVTGDEQKQENLP